ncbi:hypothetical protein OIU74_003538 [Salix koriyanagi]|uniref:Uncharacterized protein n=1 Tax=Salix koriyanagi TaxID=2511006 RepID=A0A9Q0ZLE9_9ROSI|nr:hypothetical protein OIU74_003538 [Salix koriyanagi]
MTKIQGREKKNSQFSPVYQPSLLAFQIQQFFTFRTSKYMEGIT